jgi:hypothetical protein
LANTTVAVELLPVLASEDINASQKQLPSLPPRVEAGADGKMEITGDDVFTYSELLQFDIEY